MAAVPPIISKLLLITILIYGMIPPALPGSSPSFSPGFSKAGWSTSSGQLYFFAGAQRHFVAGGLDGSAAILKAQHFAEKFLGKRAMSMSLQRPTQERMTGLLTVIALHVALLYGLWQHHVIFQPSGETTLMVNLISPKMEQPPPTLPKLPAPVEPSKPQQLVAETPAVTPNEPVAPAPQIVEAPPAPSAEPVMLSGELSISCPDRSPPTYPKMSARLKEQGKTILRVVLGADGRIARAEVKTSSGYPRLDEAALVAVKGWHCTPAVQNGQPVQAQALQPFNFILAGR
jgi:protein TonB